MSEYTYVNFGTMSQGHTDLMSSYRQIRQTLDDLERSLERHLAEWTGDARTAYHTAKAKWNQAAADMAAVLGDLGGAVQGAHQNYSSAEKANAGIWG